MEVPRRDVFAVWTSESVNDRKAFLNQFISPKCRMTVGQWSLAASLFPHQRKQQLCNRSSHLDSEPFDAELQHVTELSGDPEAKQLTMFDCRVGMDAKPNLLAASASP
jgi:hypothetical protein